MIAFARLSLVGLRDSPGRSGVRIAVLGCAAGLLGATILFVGYSLRTMSASAVRSIPLDWQGPVGSYGAATRVARAVAHEPGVLGAAPVATAPFDGIVHVSPAGTIRAGAGAILAVPPGYLAHLATFRILRGSLRPGTILFDQQLAATLQAQPGDRVTLQMRPGGPPHRFTVGGIALVTAADSLFQPLNPLVGPAPAQPPANIAILPLATFAQTFTQSLTATGQAGPSSSLPPGTLQGTQWEVQAQVDPTFLTGSPAHALQRADQIRNRVERSLPGQVQFVDNLSAGLNSAAGDALYAETLYIMLALPGALVALGLAYLAALGTAERDRRELALLRARGASRRDLLALAATESVVLGILGGGLGTGAALLAVRSAGAGGGLGYDRVLAAFGICAALAVLGALAARIGANINVLTLSVADSRRRVRRDHAPLWQRLYLDLIAFGVSGLVYWLTVRTGFSAVVNPDSNPTLSLSIYMFFAPALLWLGAALLLVRARGRVFGWLAARHGARKTSELLLASAGRRGATLNRALVTAGLLLAFGVEVGLFSATYDQQARIDAQLTLGADVVVTAPPGTIARRGLIRQIGALPGVSAVSAVDHSYAYVGPDLQDTFGVDPASLARATTLRNSYFLGTSARDAIARLRSAPDSVLVSKETITDYSLALGDLLRLRVLDHVTGQFRIVPFHVAGIVQEFPAAPRDSFMVANLSYLHRVSHDQGANTLFVKAHGDPAAVAQRVGAATKADGTQTRDIRAQTAQTVSSITTVDLGGISRIEEAFALVLVAGTMGLFVSLSLTERRREFATMAALGASVRTIASYLWTEVALVLLASLALAAPLGWLLAEMLVAMLQHVFDPPPDHLAVPWRFVAILGASAAAGALTAVGLAFGGLRRLELGATLREE